MWLVWLDIYNKNTNGRKFATLWTCTSLIFDNNYWNSLGHSQFSFKNSVNAYSTKVSIANIKRRLKNSQLRFLTLYTKSLVRLQGYVPIYSFKLSIIKIDTECDFSGQFVLKNLWWGSFKCVWYWKLPSHKLTPKYRKSALY